MSRQNKIITGVLAAAVAVGGTFIVSYPDNVAPESGPTDAGRFFLATEHVLIINGNPYSFLTDFNVTFGPKNITIKNVSGSVWPAGARFDLELRERGTDIYASDNKGKIAQAKRVSSALINLGAPDAASATSVCAAQARGAAGNATINGGNAVNGVAEFDVARGVSVTSTNAADTTQVVQIRGLDVYGKPLQENLVLNGNGVRQGVKAFKKVTRVTVSAATAGNISVGHNDVLGLPMYLPSAAHILREFQDGATAAAGTVVAGIRTEGGSTATTGDVRGTYDPSAACDGAKVFELAVILPDVGYKGIPQYYSA